MPKQGLGKYGFFCGKVDVAKEGERKFCRACRHLIRPGEQYEEKEQPKPFRRQMDLVVAHFPKCPEVGNKIRGKKPQQQGRLRQ